jgi:hypothetical protein
MISQYTLLQSQIKAWNHDASCVLILIRDTHNNTNLIYTLVAENQHR